LPMVSYPRLISRFSSFMVLTASQNGRLLRKITRIRVKNLLKKTSSGC
jgi:hypothetical protein